MKNRLFLSLFALALSAAVATAQTPGTQSSPTSGEPGSVATQNQSNQSTPMSEQPPVGQQTGKAMPSDQTGQTATAATDDESLHRLVHEQLASNPDLQNVRITVSNGVVTLDGTVAKKADKKEAKNLAKNVPGVKKVKDNLTVSATAASAATTGTANESGVASSASENPSTAATTEQQSEKPGVASSTESTTSTTTGTAGGPPEAQKPGVAGEAQSETQSSTTQSSTSSTQPPATATNPATTNPDVNSVPQNQSATGSTGTAAANATAPGTNGAMQPSTTGQAESQSSTTTTNPSNNAQSSIGSSTQDKSAQAGAASETDLQSKIQKALTSEPTLSSANVMVNVTSDKIELSGAVPTGKDRETAKRIAESYAGNRKVVDHMTVSGQGNTATPPNSANPNSTTTPPPHI